MGGIARGRSSWRGRRGACLLALLLASGAFFVACGRPGGTPTGAALPAAGAGYRGAPTAAPPSLTRTPVPTPVATYAISYDVPDPKAPPDHLGAPPSRQWATPRPEDSYHLRVDAVWDWTISGSASRSTVIALGTVVRLLPARWTTPDGARPANPHDHRETIYTPVVVEVERYLKGAATGGQLYLFALGGRVGGDSVTMGDGLMHLFEGERVVVFLRERDRQPQAYDGSPLWTVVNHYTVAEDGSARNFYQRMALQQLLDEIAAQQRP